jgi:hypothetical protein
VHVCVCVCVCACGRPTFMQLCSCSHGKDDETEGQLCENKNECSFMKQNSQEILINTNTHVPNCGRGTPATHISRGMLVRAGIQQQPRADRVTTGRCTKQRRVSVLRTRKHPTRMTHGMQGQITKSKLNAMIERESRKHLRQIFDKMGKIHIGAERHSHCKPRVRMHAIQHDAPSLTQCWRHHSTERPLHPTHRLLRPPTTDCDTTTTSLKMKKKKHARYRALPCKHAKV